MKKVHLLGSVGRSRCSAYFSSSCLLTFKKISRHWDTFRWWFYASYLSRYQSPWSSHLLTIRPTKIIQITLSPFWQKLLISSGYKALPRWCFPSTARSPSSMSEVSWEIKRREGLKKSSGIWLVSSLFFIWLLAWVDTSVLATNSLQVCTLLEDLSVRKKPILTDSRPRWQRLPHENMSSTLRFCSCPSHSYHDVSK